MNYQAILEDVHGDVEDWVGKGKVANYIPALARVPMTKFGMALRTVEGETASVGDAGERFSIQSISKVFTLTLAMKLVAEKVWDQVGREPSGSPFNSLVQLEQERGMPRNPFINAGAIAITDFIVSHTYDARQAILDFVRSLCGSRGAGFDTEVAQSEKETGFRNAALANFLKSFGRIENNVEQVLDTYFHQCSLAMSCTELAAACGYLAHEGVSPANGETIVSGAQAKRINALMLTCGTYDAAGEFAFAVGLPAKSGVGGGILAIVPKRLSLCVWSPGLGPSGNSLAGMKALECFTTRTGLSIF